jgi:endonuclease/exonuclease/phosphatase family metal-dependent hydrolase
MSDDVPRPDPAPPAVPIRTRSRLRVAAIRAGWILASTVLAAAVDFAVNGASGSWRTPEACSLAPAAGPRVERELRVFAFNAAKCDFHEGGLSFASAEEVRARLDRIAAVVERERPDLVFLSEIVMEAGPVDVHQVDYLARRSGFAAYACAENYSFGLPFFRFRSGNALLSRLPLRPLAVQQLSGARSFWSPTNNRRALWCEVEIGGEWLLVGSLRNDSFDLENNARQTREILDFVGDRPALLAGDFNAGVESASIALLEGSQRFAAGLDRRPTFPRSAPTRRIDWIFAPAGWSVIEESVVDCLASDHLAVASTWRLP